MLAAALPGELREDYQLDFRGMRSLPQELHPLFSTVDQWIHPGVEGLEVRLPADRGNSIPVALAAYHAVRGDFEITAAYQIVKADVPKSGIGVGVHLQIKKANPSLESATVAWVIRPGGRSVAAWDRATPGPDGKPVYKGGVTESSARSGQLRLQRTGEVLSYLLAEGITGDAFHQVHQCDFGTEDLERIALKLMTGGQPCAIEARWLNFRIRSQSSPSMPQPPGHHTSLWLAVAVGGTVILGGSLEGWRRWRRRPRPLQEALEKRPSQGAG
jgi:hypothetical protein